MCGSQPAPPPAPSSVIELTADDLIDDVEEQRASILAAATAAQNIAMLTGTHGVVSPPLVRPRARLPSPEELHLGALPHPDDPELGRLRAFVSARANDPVGEMRARLELARAELDRDHPDSARREAKAAAEVCDHAPAAHAMLRALLLGRSDINEQLAHVSQLVAHAGRASTRADWLCERARLLEARDGVTAESVSVWSEALALVPDHAGALYGAEVALDGTGRHAELAEMLARFADLVGNAEVAAWLHVERAIILDRKLGDTASARAALARALELSPEIGPVRSACVDHAVVHRDDAWLGALLESEASLEPDKARAVRLDLDAALAHLRAGSERARIIRCLERAHARSPSTPLVDVRVADELARLYEEEGRHGEALRVRKAALKWLGDPREELVALRAVAVTAERAGEVDDAVLALERARVIDAEDPTLIADLDRLLLSAKRHEARAILWMREAARLEDPEKKANALLVSAEAADASGRATEAAKQREAAWLTAPTAPGVYEALAERLTPVAPESAVLERINLYEHAARVTKEPDRKIHLLEKLAWLKDDVAGDVAGAQRVYEEILTIEPARLSAIVGLASAATRTRDNKALARALIAQAGVTVDMVARAELRLRAAEALGPVDPERALAMAAELRVEPAVRARAAEVVTRLHAAAGRWDRAAETLAQRAADAQEPGQRMALVLAEVDILLNRLRSPERALAALAQLPPSIADDASIRAATLDALEALGDEERLRAGLDTLAERASSPEARARLFIRAAEIDERRGRDAEAVRAYERAREKLPDDAFLVERLRRLGARVALGPASAELVHPLSAAMRAIDTAESHSAEPLLATGARDIATLRLAERLARRTGSAPQLANALALTVEAYPTGIIARRAYEGLASLVAWTLPPSDDYEPWERLLALGSADVAGLDTLVRRAHKRVLADDPAAIQVSIHAVRRRLEHASDDTERLLFNLDLARLHRRSGEIPEAGGDCKRALAVDPTSLSAACMLAEIAAELDDEDAAILASRTLASLMTDSKARAELLRDAADLSASRGDKVLAAKLLEDALRSNPEEIQIAARLAELQRSRGAFVDLASVLTEALREAHSADAIIPMASELADVARNHLQNPLLAIFSLERVREVAPSYVPSLFLLAELFIGQRAWDKALVALAQAAEATSEREEKLVALVGRASIYGRVLGQSALAEAELRAALEIDPHDPRAIRGLLDLGDAIGKDERAALLGRLVVGETQPGERLRALIELADARRAVGDIEGAEGALVEAAALSPDLRMLERVRVAVGSDTQTLARVLSRAVARAHEVGRPIDPAWLTGLGQIELDLGSYDEAIERFEEALRADDTRDDARVLLARALAARGHHEPAVAALAPVIVGAHRRFPIDANLVRLLEASLSGAGRATEQWVARELRAVAGDLAPGEQAELDARMSNVGYAEGLSAASLRKHVMPSGIGHHPIWDVAILASAFAGKLARIGLSELGSSTRERVKPKTPHPIRPLFDRGLRAFELTDVELAVSDHITVPVVACEDVPWVIVPSAFESYTDAHALAALARPMARIALGVPWLGHVGASNVLAILVAFARQVAPAFTARPAERIEPLVTDYEQRVRRAIDRKRRRMLEELAPMLERAAPIDEGVFVEAVASTEARAAFLLSGSLRASLDAVAPSDAALAEALRIPGPPSLAAVFGRASARDLASFALSGETTALRRSIGTA
jgi:tetratricopeptide (TPR) repeat protein